jgi:hypothetical protein
MYSGTGMEGYAYSLEQVMKGHTYTMAQIWKGILYIYFLETDIEGYTCNLGQEEKGILVFWDRYGRVCLSSGAGKKWHTCTMAQIWKCILNIYFLGRGMERYTCDLGTGRKWYTCILGTGMEGYACFLGQVRKSIHVQWHRYGRVYYTYIFLGQILKGIPAIWGQVGKGIPVFWGQVWKAIAGGQVRKVLPVF